MSPTNSTSPSPNTANDLLRDTYYFGAVPPWLLAAVFALVLKPRLLRLEHGVPSQARTSPGPVGGPVHP